MKDTWLRLPIPEVENAFVQVTIDLHETIVLDGVDPLEDPPGFRIRSRDLYGPLSDALIEDTRARYPVLDEIQREAAKLYAIARVRSDLCTMFPGCEFLLPTKTDRGSVVGLRFDGKAILAEGPSHWEAYHSLVRRAVQIIL